MSELGTWQQDAACRDLDTSIFFEGAAYLDALAICKRCTVREDCLEWALDNLNSTNDFGIWGGLTAKARAKLRRRRQEKAA